MQWLEGPRKNWFMVKTKGPWITRSGKPRNLEVLCEIFNMEKVANYCFKIIKKTCQANIHALDLARGQPFNL